MLVHGNDANLIECKTIVGMSPKLRVVVFSTGTRRSTIKLGLTLGESITGRLYANRKERKQWSKEQYFCDFI